MNKKFSTYLFQWLLWIWLKFFWYCLFHRDASIFLPLSRHDVSSTIFLFRHDVSRLSYHVFLGVCDLLFEVFLLQNPHQASLPHQSILPPQNLSSTIFWIATIWTSHHPFLVLQPNGQLVSQPQHQCPISWILSQNHQGYAINYS